MNPLSKMLLKLALLQWRVARKQALARLRKEFNAEERNARIGFDIAFGRNRLSGPASRVTDASVLNAGSKLSEDYFLHESAQCLLDNDPQ